MNATERKAKLKEFTDHPEKACRTGIPITYHGSIITLDAYEIPLEYLVYNPYNGRIGSVVKSYERQNHQLNPEDPDDKRIIEKFLWDSKPEANKKTKERLLKEHQQRHGMQYAKLETPAKFVKARELIETIIADGGKVVVWAIYIKNILDFEKYLISCGIPCKTLYGATPVAAGDEDEDEVETREKIIAEFHKPDSSFKVIIANPFAVSESISLHKACHNAIYLERSFNAAHFIQSKDRIHRYGLKPGTVTNYYYLLSEESIDEVIHSRLIEKETRLRDIIESMPIPLFENAGLETGDDDIKALIAEYVNRTKKM